MAVHALLRFDLVGGSKPRGPRLGPAVAACALSMGLAPAVQAQAAADQADNRAVNDFFRVMSSRITERAGTETVAVDDGRASVGYYRVRISTSSSQPPSEQKKGCKAAIKTIGNDALFDAIFARRYDMGLAVSLPLTLSTPGTGETSEARAEVNLFRLTQSAGKRCAFSLSYFEKAGDYAGPWIPIDHQATAIPQEAVIKFKPWVSRENNKARVDAFWTGLGGFVNLIGGPIAGIGTQLFGGGKDDYEIKGQANASIFSFTNDIKSADPPEATKRVIVNPTAGTSFTPNAYAFRWDLSGNDGEPFTYKLEYTIDVQYWASRLFPRDTQKKFPDLSSYDAGKFGQLLGRHDVPGGKAWNAISQSIVTLSKQDTPDKFQIACEPAFADLAAMGFSREDQVLIVYGTAMSRGFTPTQFGNIDCLSGPAHRLEVQEKLAKFNITRPVVDTPSSLPKSKSDDWYDVLAASVTAFAAPGVVDKPSSRFRRLLDAEVRIGGDTKLVTNASGAPVLGAGPTPFTLKRADLLKALTEAKPMVAGCYSPRKSAAGSPISFAFPEFSGLAPSPDRSVAHLAEVDGKVFLVVLGIAGLNRDGIPVIDQVWFGDGLKPTDEEFRGVVADMLKSTDSTCVTRPSFKAFLEGIK